MARIAVDISEEERENDNGIMVAGILATCTKCGHETFSFGTSDASVRRCLALMRDECPEEETNFYVENV